MRMINWHFFRWTISSMQWNSRVNQRVWACITPRQRCPPFRVPAKEWRCRWSGRPSWFGNKCSLTPPSFCASLQKPGVTGKEFVTNCNQDALRKFGIHVGQLTCQVTKFVPCKFSLLAIHSLLVLRLFHSFSLTEGYNPKINWDSKFIRQSMKQGPCSSINAVRFFAGIYQWKDHTARGVTHFIKDKNN